MNKPQLFPGKDVFQRILFGIELKDPDAVLAKTWFDNFFSTSKGKKGKYGVDGHLKKKFRLYGSLISVHKFVR